MEQNSTPTNNLPAAYAAPPPVPATAPAPTSYFTDIALFEAGQRMAKLLAASDLVPQQFRDNIANTLIALEMANRTGSSPLAVMQSMYIVHGKPSWSATFIIASINACGRYSPLRFKMEGEGDNLTCRACAIEKETGEMLIGPPISIATAKKEGWFGKQGSKWQTMPELMLHYRAATLFGRIYAADVLMGMRADDEMDDLGPAAPTAYAAPNRKSGEEADAPAPVQPKGAAAIDALLDREQAAEEAATEAPAEAAPTQTENKDGLTAAKQQALPQGEPDEIAEYRDAAQKCMDEIDSIDDPEALKNWWQRRDYNQTIRELGGMNSEWHQSVVEHLNARIKLLEAKQ